MGLTQRRKTTACVSSHRQRGNAQAAARSLVLGAVLSFDGGITLEFDAKLLSMTIDQEWMDKLADVVDGLEGNAWTLVKSLTEGKGEEFVLVQIEPEKLTVSYIAGRWAKLNSKKKWELLAESKCRHHRNILPCNSPAEAANAILSDAHITGDPKVATASIDTPKQAITDAIASLIDGSSSAKQGKQQSRKRKAGDPLLRKASSPTPSARAPCESDSAEATESKQARRK